MFLSEGKLMNKLITATIAGAFALGSAAAMAQDQDKAQAAYNMGKDSQKQRDLQLIESQATNQPATTAAESKALKEAAAKARAAYATMTPEEKAMYKKGMREQRQMDLQAQQAQATNQPPTTPAEQKALNAAKGQPKALQTPAERQKAMKETEKAAGPGS
jgi:hypothetical protein